MITAMVVFLLILGYLLGMVLTAFALGYATKTWDEILRDPLVFLGTAFWPFGLPVAIFCIVTGPVVYGLFKLLRSAYLAGSGDSDYDLKVGTRVKSIFERFGR